MFTVKAAPLKPFAADAGTKSNLTSFNPSIFRKRSELGDDIHPSTTTTAATPTTTNPRGLSDETVEVIQQFYQRDDISRQDVNNIWPKEGGKIKKQMRHLTSSIMERSPYSGRPIPRTSLIPQFVQHCFIKRHQAASYNLEREKAGSTSFNPTEALIQIDFSENYTCVSQDEIQSAHWNQRQVSLFTVAVWHSGSLHSSVVASDSRVHSKDTVVAYVDKVLDGLPQALKSVSVWSDDPASQFKSRFAAAIIRLQEKHNLEIRWNFFSTSHGKGPVDGIAGAVKRHVWSQVKSQKALVTNAESFVRAATGMPKVEALLMPQAEIEARNSDLGLKSVFENAKQIVGMAR
ncbi:hypothetical protein BSL78_23620 [Apostichopus japonicus]|uniref:Integrase catalytic domain-containing protein n=1 Tax=Stichopus japonicus TaxID=307972 RepID=A0A2G8JUV4_STIJA|nr:hypothetical protein BSL78_23620 [Apostichopus japonicus]